MTSLLVAMPLVAMPLVALFVVASAEGSAQPRTGGAQSRASAPRLGLRLAALPPVWIHSTEVLEEAVDAPDDGHPLGGVARDRLRGEADRAACLAELRRLGVPFVEAAPVRGVRQPVEVTGPIHGVTYKALYSKRPPLMDCHFALGLEKASRVLRGFDVTTVFYTSTYRPPPRARGQSPGHHPEGMAIDVNELLLGDGTRLVILTHWEKLYGGPGNCVGNPKTREGALLRRMTCALEEAHVFRRILSPDSDPPHKNHWHISGARIGEAFSRARWCGRTLDQPLPGDRGFDRWYRWYSCWKIADVRRRRRCYSQRARNKPRPPVTFAMPTDPPRVAIYLESQLRGGDGEEDELPDSARAVEIEPQKGTHPTRPGPAPAAAPRGAVGQSKETRP